MTERGAPQKSADAYRTISEVAEDLKLPQHVLRFWETRFPQVKPLKRAGGRRFYRPEDVHLLRAVKTLLYGDGYTIKGVQRILREQGPRAVAALAASPRLDREGAEEGPVTGPVDVGKEAIVTPEVPLDRHEPLGIGPDMAAGPPPVDARGPGRAGVKRADAGARLRDVLLDLAECERILDAARMHGR